MRLEDEDKEAILEHCEKLNSACNECLFESNTIDRKNLVTVLTQAENILLNLLEKIEKSEN